MAKWARAGTGPTYGHWLAFVLVFWHFANNTLKLDYLSLLGVTEALIKVGSPFSDFCKITRILELDSMENLLTIELWNTLILVFTWVGIYASKKQQNFHVAQISLYCLSDALTQISISQLFRVELWTCDAIFKGFVAGDSLCLSVISFFGLFFSGEAFLCFITVSERVAHTLVNLWGKKFARD